VRGAAKGKGNFGIGSGTPEQAVTTGRAWVGDNAILASDGKTWVSARTSVAWGMRLGAVFFDDSDGVGAGVGVRFSVGPDGGGPGDQGHAEQHDGVALG
jgi:hypothetical protein